MDKFHKQRAPISNKVDTSYNAIKIIYLMGTYINVRENRRGNQKGQSRETG